MAKNNVINMCEISTILQNIINNILTIYKQNQHYRIKLFKNIYKTIQNITKIKLTFIKYIKYQQYCKKHFY